MAGGSVRASLSLAYLIAGIMLTATFLLGADLADRPMTMAAIRGWQFERHRGPYRCAASFGVVGEQVVVENVGGAGGMTALIV